MPPFLSALLVALFSLWAGLAPKPAPLPPLEGPVDLIVVDKSDRVLSLVRDGRVLRRYHVSLGFAPEGPKARQGDGRTPEGVFRIDRRNAASRFHLSLGIDYPRPEDRARAAAGGYSPGGDIFIHGQPAGVTGRWRVPGDWTDGCIAVTNDAMEEIWAVAPIGTPVEIRP
ncbi:murein L,D-transpeptidase family protein [Rubellimicrobium sp. CFH 75288]|uniref:L,D-transpeptidase family protein n=1 Tax=Rubellimicrobium sp. CFH 75288 TaxID=2697034 RepID=UPI001412CFC1|nr:L,D-transpeptidase family protein [Rubellimicrobium sp. CFH 75288]NAZ38068.1 L,D-transpeptidase family protein [Rubellimicrobium sp. CFH 75288]